MSSFSDYLEDAVLNHVFRNTALTSPASVHLALFTTLPTDSAAGTEVAGNNYGREAITFGAPSGGAIANTVAVSFNAIGGNFGTVTAVGIYDAATAGNMLAWADITDATVNDGDTLTFAIGDIDVTLS